MYILIKWTGLDQSDPIIRLIPLSGIPLSGVYCNWLRALEIPNATDVIVIEFWSQMSFQYKDFVSTILTCFFFHFFSTKTSSADFFLRSSLLLASRVWSAPPSFWFSSRAPTTSSGKTETKKNSKIIIKWEKKLKNT